MVGHQEQLLPARDHRDQQERLLPARELILDAVEQRRAAWTPVDQVAALLTAAHLVVLLVVVAGGSLYLDDLRAQGYALDQPFLPFILGSNGTHFAPVPRVLDWVQSRAFPLEHGPAVVVTLVVRLLLAVAFWRLLRRIFGPRPAVLVPFTILLFTPALLAATLWYRQAITVVACTAAIVWALDAFVAWLLERRAGSLVTLAVSTAVAVGCYEKGAMIPVILAGAYLALAAGRGGVLRDPDRRLRSGHLRAAAAGVGLTGLLVAGFLVIYRSGPYDQGASSPPGVDQILHLAWDTTTRTMVPMLLGGPWRWYPDTPYAGGFHPGPAVVVTVLVLVGIGLLPALVRAPGALARAAVLLLAAMLPSVTIVAVGRLDAAGELLADTSRLWADLVPFFLLAAALALIPVSTPGNRSVPSPRPNQAPNQAPIQALNQAPDEQRRDRRDRRKTPRDGAIAVLAGLGALAVLGGSALSTATYAAKWWDNPTGDWIADARAGLATAGPQPRILATPLPQDVMPTWVSVKFPTSAPLLLLMRPDLRFHDGDGTTLVTDARGKLITVLPYLISRTPGTAQCAAQLPADQVRSPWITLASDAVYLPGAQIEVGLLTGGRGRVQITMRTPTGEVLTPQRFSDQTLPAGAYTVRVPVPLGATVRSVQVSVDDGADTCITQVQVWAPVT